MYCSPRKFSQCAICYDRDGAVCAKSSPFTISNAFSSSPFIIILLLLFSSSPSRYDSVPARSGASLLPAPPIVYIQQQPLAPACGRERESFKASNSRTKDPGARCAPACAGGGCVRAVSRGFGVASLRYRYNLQVQRLMDVLVFPQGWWLQVLAACDV